MREVDAPCLRELTRRLRGRTRRIGLIAQADPSGSRRWGVGGRVSCSRCDAFTVVTATADEHEDGAGRDEHHGVPNEPSALGARARDDRDRQLDLDHLRQVRSLPLSDWGVAPLAVLEMRTANHRCALVLGED